PTGPLSVYGRTKLDGEQRIQDSGVPHLIFRTAWVYAREGKNFLRTILRLATQKEELKIVADQIGAPTCSADIALATVRTLSRIYSSVNPPGWPDGAYGIYHMTAAGRTSWYEFAKAILEEAAAGHSDPWLAEATNGQSIVRRRVIPITTAEYPTPARRPVYSVLSNERLAQAFGFRLDDWRSQLRRCFTGQGASLVPYIIEYK
ncbi:MAG: SDR family oxidoreductase, partial [Candidatus Acidiferrales bacterium]